MISGFFQMLRDRRHKVNKMITKRFTTIGLNNELNTVCLTLFVERARKANQSLRARTREHAKDRCKGPMVMARADFEFARARVECLSSLEAHLRINNEIKRLVQLLPLVSLFFFHSAMRCVL
jgi:hypothetical protein